MGRFLVESYRSRLDAAPLDRGASQARLAAEEQNRQGTSVRYLGPVLPEDETCLLYEAQSAEAVRLAARRVATCFERITEVVRDTPPLLQNVRASES